MSYDSRLYIGIPLTIADDNGALFVDAVCTLDLANMGSDSPFGQLRNRSLVPPAPVYVIPGRVGDGMAADPRITIDGYEKPLQPLNPKATLAALDKMIANDERLGSIAYRRLYPAAAVLRSFLEHEDQWPGLVVLHYGY